MIEIEGADVIFIAEHRKRKEEGETPPALPPMFQRTTQPVTCFHSSMLVDYRAREITCADCHKLLDPFEAISKIERLSEDVKNSRAQKQQLSTEILALKKEIAGLKQMWKRWGKKPSSEAFAVLRWAAKQKCCCIRGGLLMQDDCAVCVAKKVTQAELTLLKSKC